MAEYIKEKWSADFPDRAGQEVRPTEAVENTLDYDVLFPQYLSEDPVVFNQQNRTVSQLVSNDARLYERISATAADINAHLTDAKAHASGISGNAASASKLQTGRKIHRVLFDGTRDITLPDFSGCGEKTAGQSGMVPSPAAGKLNTVLHSNGSWGKVTYADMDEEAVAKIQACPFPVNAIYISTDGKNPATYWPGTTWVAFAMGRCLIGAGAADSGPCTRPGTSWAKRSTPIPWRKYRFTSIVVQRLKVVDIIITEGTWKYGGTLGEMTPCVANRGYLRRGLLLSRRNCQI